MLTKTYSAALTGIEALPLEVEVNASGRGEQDFVSTILFFALFLLCNLMNAVGNIFYFVQACVFQVHRFFFCL